jgi:hypothetical protein
VGNRVEVDYAIEIVPERAIGTIDETTNADRVGAR